MHSRPGRACPHLCLSESPRFNCLSRLSNSPEFNGLSRQSQRPGFNLFSTVPPTGIKLTWHPQGDYLAVQVRSAAPGCGCCTACRCIGLAAGSGRREACWGACLSTQKRPLSNRSTFVCCRPRSPVQVDKWTKTKKSTTTNFELFSIR